MNRALKIILGTAKMEDNGLHRPQSPGPERQKKASLGQRMMRVREAAEYLGSSPWKVRQLIASRLLPFEQTHTVFDRNRKVIENLGRVEMNWKLDVKETGEKKNINGLDTKEVVMTITMEGTDQKTGQSGAMDTVSDMWLTPKVPGYEEINDISETVSIAPDCPVF